MNWKELWMTLFGTTEWLGLNIGFWVALAAVLLIVILMNVLFWSMKPKTDTQCTFRINGAPFPRQRCKRLAPAVRYPFVVTC